VFLVDGAVAVLRFARRVVGVVARVITITLAPPAKPTNCDDPGTAVCGSNPRQCGTSVATVDGSAGGLADYPACGSGPHTLVRTQGGFTGLDSAARAQLSFAPSSVVTVQLVHFSQPARVEALGGGSAQVRFMKPTPQVVQELIFTGTGIDRIIVTPASPSDVTLILGWCH
jgi:hypothetical protein